MISIVSNVQDFVRSHRALVGAAAAATAVGIYTAHQLYRAAQLPPGPWGLPILGRLPWLDLSHLEDGEEQMRQKYGDIYSYRAGQRLMIVVSSYELLKEMLQMDMFSGRMAPPSTVRLARGCGIGFTEGATWREQRRVCLRVLREFGFGKAESIKIIQDEVSLILEALEQKSTQVDTFDLFNSMSNSVVTMLVFGRRYANEDQRFGKFIEGVQAFFNNSLSSSLELLFPSFKFLMRRLPASKRAEEATLFLQQFIEEEIATREAQLIGSGDEKLCVFDTYISERRKAEARGDTLSFQPFQLVRVGLEMFLAGTDTTARSLQWLLLYMSINPTVQSRVHQEIDNVIGRSKKPEMSHRQQMHYTQAVIDEGMRLSSLVFNGVPHRALEDTQFHGYRIPADAAIITFVYGVHNDPKLWERPDEFYPGHFLDSSGEYAPNKHLMPFAFGKRVCPGESLAKLELFLGFVGVMQHYSVELSAEDRGRVDEIVRGVMTTLRTPADHTVNFMKR